MNSKPVWVTQVVVSFIGLVLMTTACATAPVSRPLPWPASPSPDLLAQGANVEATRTAGQALADAASTQIALANVQGTQVAAQLTATPAAATQAWQATEHALAVQQTEQAIARFNADATATASSAQTADAFALMVRINELTSTAQTERTSTAQAEIAATATQRVISTATAAALATVQARAAREAQTALFWIWFPVIALTLLVGLAFVFGWRMLRVLETRQRIIQQQHGGPLIILEQKRSLTEYLPRVLRWLAWFLESNTVVVDPDRNVHPVTVIQDGTALSPTLTELPSQECTTARDQAVLLAAVLPAIIEGQVWRVKFRLATAPKYLQVRRERPIGVLYNAEAARHRRVIVFTEGEFDCLLLEQWAHDLAGVVTLGAQGDELDVGLWGRYLLDAEIILVMYDVDADQTGRSKSEGGLLKLLAKSQRIRRVEIPTLKLGDKDITDYWRSGGNLFHWLSEERLHVLDSLFPDLATHQAHLLARLQDKNLPALLRADYWADVQARTTTQSASESQHSGSVYD